MKFYSENLSTNADRCFTEISKAKNFDQSEKRSIPTLLASFSRRCVSSYPTPLMILFLENNQFFFLSDSIFSKNLVYFYFNFVSRKKNL